MIDVEEQEEQEEEEDQINDDEFDLRWRKTIRRAQSNTSEVYLKYQINSNSIDHRRTLQMHKTRRQTIEQRTNTLNQ